MKGIRFDGKEEKLRHPAPPQGPPNSVTVSREEGRLHPPLIRAYHVAHGARVFHAGLSPLQSTPLCSPLSDPQPYLSPLGSTPLCFLSLIHNLIFPLSGLHSYLAALSSTLLPSRSLVYTLICPLSGLQPHLSPLRFAPLSNPPKLAPTSFLLECSEGSPKSPRSPQFPAQASSYAPPVAVKNCASQDLNYALHIPSGGTFGCGTTASQVRVACSSCGRRRLRSSSYG